jgi:DNA-directed RNA polymerase specialized sigma24 family protein
MSSTGSISLLLTQLPQGEQDTIQELWKRYFHRLVGLARKKLGNLPRRAADEEDVALSAFNSFCRAAEVGRFPRLLDRDDLWQVLVLLTARKVCDLRDYLGRDKRDWRRLQEEMQHDAAESSWQESALSGLLSREADPAFAAEVAEQTRQLLDSLGDHGLRQIAVWKMEGHTNQEIADRLGWPVYTVERRLRLIRKRWEQHGLTSANPENLEERP